MQRLSGDFQPIRPNILGAIGAQTADVIVGDGVQFDVPSWSPDIDPIYRPGPSTPPRTSTNVTRITNLPHGITILGWSILYRGAIGTVFIPPPTNLSFIKWGTLWGGLLTDPSAVGNPPSLPSDLSTFTKLWTPDSSPWPMASWVNNTPLTNTPDGITFMLPSPIPIEAGQEVGVMLSLGKSLGQNARRIVWSASWSILYDFT